MKQNPSHPQPIVEEERVYRDVLPFVRMFQGLWLAGASSLVVFVIHHTLLGRMLPLTSIIQLTVFIAVLLWVSFSLCRMSIWLGGIALFMNFVGLVFTIILNSVYAFRDCSVCQSAFTFTICFLGSVLPSARFCRTDLSVLSGPSRGMALCRVTSQHQRYRIGNRSGVLSANWVVFKSARNTRSH